MFFYGIILSVLSKCVIIISNLDGRMAYTVKVKCNISKKQDLLIIYISYVSPYSPSGSCFNKMIIMSCFTLNTISLFQGTITKVRLANSFNSYWLPCWRVPWLDLPHPSIAAILNFFFILVLISTFLRHRESPTVRVNCGWCTIRWIWQS